MNGLMTYLSDNPFSGLGIWATGWVASILPETKITRPILNILTEESSHVREAHLWWFQMISLTIGTIVGILTIVTLIQKIRDRRLERKYKRYGYRKTD